MTDIEGGSLRELLEERERLILSFAQLERRIAQLRSDVVRTNLNQSRALVAAPLCQ